MLFFKIAWRNIFRNPKRSLITVTTVCIGIVALIFLWGLTDGAHDQVFKKITGIYSGHLVVAGKGFHGSDRLDITLPKKEDLFSQLENDKDVVSYTRRASFASLIGTYFKSRGIILVGVDPINEPKVTKLHEFIIEGDYLEENDENEILISQYLANDLKAKIGKKIVLMGQDVDGGFVGEAFRVKGIFQTGSDVFDGSKAVVNLKKAQELFALGNDIYTVSIRSENSNAVENLVSKLRVNLDKGYEILPWTELPILRNLARYLDYEKAVIAFISLIFLLIVASGIMNTMLMSVMERTREFGVMSAMGVKPSQVIMTVSLESLLLSSIGIILGILIGILAVLYYGHFGVDISHFSKVSSTDIYGGKIFTKIALDHLFPSIVLAFLISLLASVYPAWKATRMDPVQAVREF